MNFFNRDEIREKERKSGKFNFVKKNWIKRMRLLYDVYIYFQFILYNV